MPELVILQTAAGEYYEKMLVSTKQQHDDFAASHGATRQTFFGVRRGYYPWHAAFNRIFLLKDLLLKGYRGWALYLDADAVIINPSFDIQSFLVKRSKDLIIAARGALQGVWDVNDGIFMLNFGHVGASELVERWHSDFTQKVSELDLQNSEKPWSLLYDGNVIDDQTLLQNILKDPKFHGSIYIDNENLLNYFDATFIKQIIRTKTMTAADRLDMLLSFTNSKNLSVRRFIQDLYKGVLNREPDAVGFEDAYHRVENGYLTMEQYIKELVSSQEFFTLWSDKRFVNDQSQFGEIDALLHLWADDAVENKIVVDAGARGRERSNSYDLMRHYGWKGVLIEANAALINTIKSEFADLDYVLLNTAVSNYNGTALFNIGINDDVSSLSIDHTASWGEPRDAVRVDVRRLAEILEELQVPRNFGLLSLDIEGEDHAVLNDIVEQGYCPKWVIIEGSHGGAITDLAKIPGFSSLTASRYKIRQFTYANIILQANSDYQAILPEIASI